MAAESEAECQGIARSIARACNSRAIPILPLRAVVRLSVARPILIRRAWREPDLGVTSANYDFAELLARAEPQP
jgi:hypothetical protein